MATTETDLKRIAESINIGLNGKFTVHVAYRNGYAYADLYNAAGSFADVLCAGTKGQVYLYLQGMRKMYLLL